MKRYIFGARATATGLYKALSLLEPDKKIEGFLVSTMEGNPQEIWGCPVCLLRNVSAELPEEERAVAEVYVAVPELMHEEVVCLLRKQGFSRFIMMDSRKEAAMMEQFYKKCGEFHSIHDLPIAEKVGRLVPKISVYAATFYKDKPLARPPIFPFYVRKLYLGCDKAKRLGFHIPEEVDFRDDEGDNISAKNPNRCEMTAHYWVWKNRLDTEDEYVGICHYRRMLDMDDDDLGRMLSNDVDVVLPFPMVHFPDGGIHHTWYVPEKDWKTLRRALRELYPTYEEKFDVIFGQPYFYNYNMLIAKKEVFADYCAWLYPLLDRVEEISNPKGVDREDRYTAYMSESLTTLYFMFHREELKVYHTGRLLFT